MIKYSCESNFLRYYQVVSAIPKRLWSLAKGSDTINKSFFTRNDNLFSLEESTQINPYKAKSKELNWIEISNYYVRNLEGNLAALLPHEHFVKNCLIYWGSAP